MVESVRVFVSHHHSPEEDVFTARLFASLEAAGGCVGRSCRSRCSGFLATHSRGAWVCALGGRQRPKILRLKQKHSSYALHLFRRD